jgi:hypothetical protein
MTIHDQILPKEAFELREPTSSLSSWIRSVGLQIVMWVETCADYYAAAAMYEQLSGLSDAELMHRGLSRGTLAQDICAACDRELRP